MPDARWITELLAGFIQQPNVPPEAIAIAGEIITLDARLAGESIPAVPFEELYKQFEPYDNQLKRTAETIGTFLGADPNSLETIQELIRGLSNIKRALTEMSLH